MFNWGAFKKHIINNACHWLEKGSEPHTVMQAHQDGDPQREQAATGNAVAAPSPPKQASPSDAAASPDSPGRGVPVDAASEIAPSNADGRICSR